MAVQDLWRGRDGQPTARDGRGKRWRVVVDGWPTTAYTTRRQAEVEHARRLALGPPAPADTTTMGVLLDAWLETKRGLSTNGYRACRNIHHHLRPEWGDRLAVEITRHEIQAWLATMQALDMSGARPDGHPVALHPASGSTRAKALQALRGSLEIAVQRGILEANPAAGLSAGRQTRRAIVTLAPGELAALAQACDGYEALVWLLGSTGLRIGEACALDVGDVDVQRRRAVVRSAKNGDPREVPVPERVLSMLPLEDRKATEPLFVGVYGQRLNSGWWRRHRFDPAAVAIGRPDVTPHVLRHTAASLAIRAGADVKAVQRMLGHKSATMTLDTYGHLWDAGLDDVAARIGALLE